MIKEYAGMAYRARLIGQFGANDPALILLLKCLNSSCDRSRVEDEIIIDKKQ